VKVFPETDWFVSYRVGNPNTGVIEISDMLFAVQGATAGAILVEWNVHESDQGSGKSNLAFLREIL